MVGCKKVIDSLSEYLDGDIRAELRQQIAEHLRGCANCSAVYDSTRKVLIITGDERVFEIPAGFSERLHKFLDESLSGW